MLKTGENGRWLTTVVPWHMQYSLKWISRQWHDQASEPCMNTSLWELALFGIVMRCRHTHWVLMHQHFEQHRQCPVLLTMSSQSFVQYLSHIILYGQQLVACVIGTHVPVWIHTIIVWIALEILPQICPALCKGQPGEFDFLCIFALLIFLRVNTVFGCVMLKFFGHLVNFNFPGVQDALRRSSTIFQDIAFCNVAKALFEQIVSFFFFAWSIY